MIQIDPARLDLAREFRARPFGVHSPDLQAVLNRMRGGAGPGRYVLYMTRPHAEWVLGRIDARCGRPLYVGRHAGASPATGLMREHKAQQDALVDAALTVKKDR